MKQTHLRTCTQCQAMCGLQITHEQGLIVSIKGDPKDPLSQGQICPKAQTLKHLHHDPQRLRHPLLKTPDGWERISWEAALDEASSRIRSTQAKYGKNAVGIYQGHSCLHSPGITLMIRPLLSALGSINRFSSLSMSHIAPMLAAMKLWGNPYLMPVPDVERTHTLIALTPSSALNAGKPFPTPGMGHRVSELQLRGGQFIVIDCVDTDMSRQANQSFLMTPGSEALLLMAILHSLFQKGIIQPDNLKAQLRGVNHIKKMVSGFSPEHVSRAVGLSTDDIYRLVTCIEKSPRTCLIGPTDASEQAFSTLTHWLIYLINLLTDNFDKPGGMMFTQPAIDIPGISDLINHNGSFNSRKSRVEKLPEFCGEFPASTLATEMLTEGKGQIRSLITIGGNPGKSLPNQAQVQSALSKLDFLVCIDTVLNETNQHADLILPPTDTLENEHYDLILNLYTPHNTARYSKAMDKTTADTRHDWQIILELSRRIQSQSPFRWLTGGVQYQVYKQLGTDRCLDLLLRSGHYGTQPDQLKPAFKAIASVIYRYFEGSYTAQLFNIGPFSRHMTPSDQNLTLKSLLQKSHGLDLGDLQQGLLDRLQTKGKCINLAPNLLIKDIARLQEYLTVANNRAPDSFVLLSSASAGINWQATPENPLSPALIHPDSAERLHIQQDDILIISSGDAEQEYRAELDESVVESAICVPLQWGVSFDYPDILMQTDAPSESVLFNACQERDTLSGNWAFNSAQVTVSTYKREPNVVRMNDKRLKAG